MKIIQIECTLLETPLPAPLRPAWAPGRVFTHSSCTLLQVHTDEGITGIGAGPEVGMLGIHTISELLAPYILGMDPFMVERIAPYIRTAARDGSYPWALDMALWDIIGKTTGQPVYRLWGGYQNRIPVYASMAEVTEASEQIARLQQLRDHGFKAFKLRLRRPDIRDDIRLVEQVRAALGDEIDLMVDGNQAHVMPSPQPSGYWTYEQALTVARAMEQLNVLWLEEPLPRYNYKQLARLADAVDIPIAGGELNIGLHEYKLLIDMDCYDIIQADAAFSEGISQLRKVASMAELAYKKFIPHTWSNGIGLGANLHLAASLPNCPWFEFPVDPPAWTIESRDFMLTQPFDIDEDGSITVSDIPGLGLRIDADAITRYSKEHWQSDRLAV
ncbi:MAG: mandelate racemase/muconate lactonizing enzyme family protein [Anaerolineae bacterium]|nr:mandelate racemase/muconate lactonizing enzyme family protein [Anaerolineae bacterium]